MILCTLKELFESHDEKQITLSDETHITRPTLLALMRNENQNIKYETINSLCKHYKIPLNELLVYSPVDIELKEINVNTNDPKEYYDPTTEFKTRKNMEVLTIEAVYIIDNEKFIFDTGVLLGNKEKSRRLIKDDINLSCELSNEYYLKLTDKGFDLEFFKLYNRLFEVDEQIRKKLPYPFNNEIRINFKLPTTEKVNELFKEIYMNLSIDEIKALSVKTNNYINGLSDLDTLEHE